MSTNCTFHCAVCNGHFHSERAFTKHRAGGDCLEPRDDDLVALMAVLERTVAVEQL